MAPDPQSDELAFLRGLLNTAYDVILEGLAEKQTYDYKPRAKACAKKIEAYLRDS